MSGRRGVVRREALPICSLLADVFASLKVPERRALQCLLAARLNDARLGPPWVEVGR